MYRVKDVLDQEKLSDVNRKKLEVYYYQMLKNVGNPTWEDFTPKK